MATWTYEDVHPTLIPNTTMQKVFMDGVHKAYYITPIAGYVLHGKNRDWEDTDEEGNVIAVHQGFSRTMASCLANYDFTPLTVTYTDANGNLASVTAYGAQREFYAVPEDSVPADHIFGVGSDHEIM